MKISYKRAENTSLLCGFLSILFFVFAFILGSYSNSFAIAALKWQFLAGVIISVVLWFGFRLQTLAEREKLDLAQLAKKQEDATIFQEGRQIDMFAVVQKRLELFKRWFVPAFAVVIAIYQAGIGAWLAVRVPALAGEPVRQAQITAILIFLLAFITFLISRYAVGMSVQNEWKPLRAIGSWMLGAAVVSFVIAIGMGLAQLKITLVHTVIGWVVPYLLIVVGVETALNIVFDIYRPRISGQYHRSSFDSRILSLLSEPGGIFHSIAHTIDYQFGFKVSQTWFYKLFEKAVLPLVLLSVFVLWLMSGFMVIVPGQQAIIERFGSPLNQGQPFKPGLKIKYPWPIDIAYVEDVDKIQIANIGFVPKEFGDRTPLLWGTEHHKSEDNLLVGSTSDSSTSSQGAGAFSIVVTAVPVHYRISNLHDFIYNNENPREIFEAIAYRELTRFAASARIETDDKDAESLLGAGRAKAARILKKNIQTVANQHGLGVEIVFVGLEGVHPPKEVALSYQEVVGAVQTRQKNILRSLAERNKILALLGGSVENVRALHELAQKYQQAKFANDPGYVELEKQFDKAITQAKGQIYQKLRTAKSQAFEKATNAKATGQRFASQLKAFNAAPTIYPKELRLSMLERALKGIRKYFVIADVNDYQVIVFDLKDKIVESLYDIEVEEGK